MRQRSQSEIMLDVRPFCFFGAEKFSAGRKVEKKLSNFDRCSGRASSGFDLMNLSATDDYLRSFGRIRIALVSSEGKPAHARDARKRLAAKTHCCDGGQIFSALNFARGVALQTKQRIVATHPHAVISNANQTSSTRLN